MNGWEGFLTRSVICHTSGHSPRPEPGHPRGATLNRAIILALCLILVGCGNDDIDNLEARIADLEEQVYAAEAPVILTQTETPTPTPTDVILAAPKPPQTEAPTPTPSPTPESCALDPQTFDRLIEDFGFASERALSSQSQYDRAFEHAETLYEMRRSLMEGGCIIRRRAEIALLKEELRGWDTTHYLCTLDRTSPQIFNLDECHTYFFTNPGEMRTSIREQLSELTDQELEEMVERLLEEAHSQ